MKRFSLLSTVVLLFCGIAFSFSQDSSGDANALFIRIFKYEDQLEIWEQKRAGEQFKKKKTISICAASGILGPKRKQGDQQVPEGFYRISHFNPNSKYHLSLRINYPNQSDKIRTTNAANPGGDIMIHGGCASIGCVAIGNNKIEYLYDLLKQQKANGQQTFPVHIFPCKMNALRYDVLKYVKRKDNKLIDFWEELEGGFNYFESNRQVPNMLITPKGDYQFEEEQPLL